MEIGVRGGPRRSRGPSRGSASAETHWKSGPTISSQTACRCPVPLSSWASEPARGPSSRGFPRTSPGAHPHIGTKGRLPPYRRSGPRRPRLRERPGSTPELGQHRPPQAPGAALTPSKMPLGRPGCLKAVWRDFLGCRETALELVCGADFSCRLVCGAVPGDLGGRPGGRVRPEIQGKPCRGGPGSTFVCFFIAKRTFVV